MKGSLTMSRKFILILALSAVTAVGCLLLVLAGNRRNELQRADYQQIASMQYDSVFLSMYPIDTYREEDFSYFRGMTLFKASYCIPSFSVLKNYLRHLSSSGNQITTAYLGIRPDLTDPRKLQKLLSGYPDITFEIMLAYPSSEYWKALTQKEYEDTLAAYLDFFSAAPEIPEANFYCFGTQEWLTANPGNYQDDWSVNENVARTLMAYSDRDHGFLITAENSSACAEALTTLTFSLRSAPAAYPDLSNRCVVFFGDSVIGNYTDSTSIPGVVSGLTGAEVYNCGYGGNSAAMMPGLLISLPGIIEAFFQGDLSVLPEETQVYAGISSYLENASPDRQICFVINYGLNDYFSGYPISSEEPYNIATYSGAVRTAVKLIREYEPDAQIILCTPNFSSVFDNGTEPHGTDGLVLTDYVNAVLSLSEELQTDVLDNYHDLGITPENEGQYLADQVHPNDTCRFLIGSNLSRMIR